MTIVRVVTNSSGGYQQIGLGEGMPRLAAFLDQQVPSQQHIFVNRQYPLPKHRAHDVHSQSYNPARLTGSSTISMPYRNSAMTAALK